MFKVHSSKFRVIVIITQSLSFSVFIVTEKWEKTDKKHIIILTFVPVSNCLLFFWKLTKNKLKNGKIRKTIQKSVVEGCWKMEGPKRSKRTAHGREGAWEGLFFSKKEVQQQRPTQKLRTRPFPTSLSVRTLHLKHNVVVQFLFWIFQLFLTEKAKKLKKHWNLGSENLKKQQQQNMTDTWSTTKTPSTFQECLATGKESVQKNYRVQCCYRINSLEDQTVTVTGK